MDYIVFDLEWNQCPNGKDKENKHLPFEIIEIGAVKLNENRETSQRFHRIIKPVVYEQMHFRTQEIIRIDKESLNQGVTFPSALRDFLEWCGPDACFCTWGGNGSHRASAEYEILRTAGAAGGASAFF